MRIYRLLSVLLLLGSSVATFAADFHPADYVNPFIGASTNQDASGTYHGLGKTFPGATTPYGMVQVSPNTITGGDNGSGYSYEHKTIEGFAMTQMSGVGWYGDLGNFLVMPTTGKMYTSAGVINESEHWSVKGWRSAYDKETEKASAGYYSVMLTDYGIKTECSATPHCGALRFTFPASNESRIQIDLARRVGGTSVEQYVQLLDDHTIRGWMKCTPEGGGWGNGDGKADYTVYFYAVFSKPISDYGFWKADIPDTWTRKREDIESQRYQRQIAQAEITKDVKELRGKHIGFFTQFPTREGEEVEMKVGISFVDMTGAENNYRQEVINKDFNAIQRQAYNLWDKALNCISVEGGTAEERTVFYTALYHTMIDPRTFDDVDGRYMGADHKIHHDNNGSQCTIFSGWDVFRSQFPLLTIINPRHVNDMINSLITMADESGKHYFPRWELLKAYTGCMIGNPALSVITDAYMKGIRNYDVNKAFEYSLITSEKFGNGNLGYSTGGAGISLTLEYAYTDWCLAQFAKALGKNQTYKDYMQKSLAYKNVFDKEKGWFRPRNDDGSWMQWPENGRLTEGYGCVESNPYQQGWFVPHDIDGMVKLMGGRKKALADLISMFNHTPETFIWNQYYNHANEPVHAVPFLFNRLGSPWLTQKYTRFICSHAYKNKVEGLIGNEDVGQMSAWYVLAATGIHPICPGDTRMEITSPVFDSITYNLPTGKKFRITTHNNSSENVYIQSATLNGKPYDKCHIDYKDIMAGGTLDLYLGNSANKSFGKH